ncbi:hypothetical protein AB0M95_14240 [Sphaerisporangium sp. NPDC051017]|uniref:hypothetical protein n=1 Tax=Sphaerisporangium sp. NPDC051017 TaxID=3154636 RepID=UPI00344AD8CA
MSRTPDDLRTVCWDLPNTQAMVGKARRLVADVLAKWGLDAVLDDVVLVVGDPTGPRKGPSLRSWQPF